MFHPITLVFYDNIYTDIGILQTLNIGNWNRISLGNYLLAILKVNDARRDVIYWHEDCITDFLRDTFLLIMTKTSYIYY